MERTEQTPKPKRGRPVLKYRVDFSSFAKVKKVERTLIRIEDRLVKESRLLARLQSQLMYAFEKARRHTEVSL